MCDFCEKIKPLTKENKQESALSSGVRYDEDEKCFCLYTVGTEGDFDDDYLEIEYCPLCGRKLSEETEKPSTEEILATLKEKLTEDEYLKLKESAEMFSDGINGLWEVLGKGIE